MFLALIAKQSSAAVRKIDKLTTITTIKRLSHFWWLATWILFLYSYMSSFCSTKGVGSTAPDKSKAKSLEDGVVVPLGKPKANTEKQVTFFLHKHQTFETKGKCYHELKWIIHLFQGSLLYNEYIVYNVEQIRMRYIVQVNFKWN